MQPIQVDAIAVANSEVPGEQTLPRAEFWADIMANRLNQNHKIQPAEGRTNLIDALYVVRGAQKESEDRLLEGANDDLWQIRDDERACQDRRLNRAAEKVKAHAQRPVLEGRLDPEKYLRNVVADAAADSYASRLLQVDEISEAVKWEKHVSQIALRLATLYAEVMDGMPEEVQLPPDVGIKPMAKDLEEEVIDLKKLIEARGH